MAFLGASLFSMALLFAVSLSDASFSVAYKPLPDPFAPEKVVNKIDAFAAGYSTVLVNFSEPVRDAFAIHWDQIKWVGQEASASLAQTWGSKSAQPANQTNAPQVAGAFKISRQPTLSMDTLYSLLLGKY